MTHWIGLLCLVGTVSIAMPGPTAASNFVFPSGYPGEVAKLYFEAFNGEGTERMRAFILEHRSESALARTPMEARLARLSQMRGMLGHIDPRAVTAEAPHFTIAAYSEKAGIWFSFAFDFEEDPPHKLETITIQPTGDPGRGEIDLGGSGSLKDMLAAVVENSTLPGIAAAFATIDGSVEHAAHGVRVSGENDPIREDDRFHIGSVTKSMTATAFGDLLESGKLELSDTLEELLPGFTMHDAYREVTLRQLLGHRAGLTAYTTDDEVFAFTAVQGTPREQRAAFTTFVLEQKPFVVPGQSFQYSNAGYSVAAHVAEVASGESWETLLESRLFEPLKMQDSGFGWPATKNDPDHPRGHYAESDTVRPQALDDPYRIPAYLAPAGDVYCSAPDLARYVLMHLRGLQGEEGILEPGTLRDLHAPDPAWGTKDTYAGGWLIEEIGRVYRHGGSAATFYCLVELDLQAGLASVVLMNSGDMGNERLARGIIDEYKKRLDAK